MTTAIAEQECVFKIGDRVKTLGGSGGVVTNIDFSQEVRFPIGVTKDAWPDSVSYWQPHELTFADEEVEAPAFKVGDKVRIADPAYCNWEDGDKSYVSEQAYGQTGTVIESESWDEEEKYGNIAVQIDGIGLSQIIAPAYLTPIEEVEETPAFKVGDRVCLSWLSDDNGDQDRYGDMLGAHGTVQREEDYYGTIQVLWDFYGLYDNLPEELTAVTDEAYEEDDDCDCCAWITALAEEEPVDVLRRPMSSSDLAEAIEATVNAVRSRVEGVGHDQYAEGDGQQFESMKVSDLLEMAREEAQDLVAYAVMTDIRLARIQAAISGQGL